MIVSPQTYHPKTFEEKIQNLNLLLASYPNSAFTDDALYEIGESHLSQQQYEKAISNFQRIVNTFPNSSYVSKALIKLGLIYFNNNRARESLKLYKTVVSNIKFCN